MKFAWARFAKASISISSLLLANLFLVNSATADKVLIGKSCTKERAQAKVAKDILICTKLDSKLSWQPSVSQIEERAWREIQSARASQVDVSTSLEVYFSPTVNKNSANEILKSINEAAKLWQKQYLPEKLLPALFFTEKDREWFIATMQKIGVYSEHQLSNFDDEVSRNGNRGNWAGVTGDGGRLWMTYMIGTARGKSDSNDLQVAAHEYTHLAQNALSARENLSCWQIEGGAFFYGMFVGARTPKEIKAFAQVRNTEPYFGGFTGLVKQSPNSFPKLIDNFQSPDNNMCGPDGAYPVGSAMHEYLFSLKGHTGIIEMLQNSAAEGDFYKGIEKTYGKPWPMLKSELANYLKLVVAQANY